MWLRPRPLCSLSTQWLPSTCCPAKRYVHTNTTHAVCCIFVAYTVYLFPTGAAAIFHHGVCTGRPLRPVMSDVIILGNKDIPCAQYHWLCVCRTCVSRSDPVSHMLVFVHGTCYIRNGGDLSGTLFLQMSICRRHAVLAGLRGAH
ncbi:hypothetical protein ORF128L [Spotted knifejaw iridovirus]|nr:hypothetical protein ORF128L [Spotted knifejaw iridovirus]